MKNLGLGWWDSVFRMYAEMMLDITPLVNEVLESRNYSSNSKDYDRHVRGLYKLLPFAPNTEAKAKYVIEEEMSNTI